MRLAVVAAKSTALVFAFQHALAVFEYSEYLQVMSFS